MLASKVGFHDFDGNETLLIVLFPQTAPFVDAKNYQASFWNVSLLCLLGSTYNNKAIGSYFDGTYSDAKVNRNFRRWKR